MLEDAAKIVRLDGSNSRFEMKNGFLTLTLTVGEEEKSYDRVFLHRAFPHELLWEYISVVGDENRDVLKLQKALETTNRRNFYNSQELADTIQNFAMSFQALKSPLSPTKKDHV